MFDHISKHLEVRQKYSAARRIFNSLLGVWKCGQTLSFVFDILRNVTSMLCSRHSAMYWIVMLINVQLEKNPLHPVVYKTEFS